MTLGEPNTPCHIIGAILAVFSLFAPKIPVAELKDQTEFLSELVLQVLRSPLQSSVISDTSVNHWAQCLDFAVSLLPGLKAEAINELHHKEIKRALQHFFRSELLLEILVSECGPGAFKAVMPEKQMNLLTNVRKV